MSGNPFAVPQTPAVPAVMKGPEQFAGVMDVAVMDVAPGVASGNGKSVPLVVVNLHGVDLHTGEPCSSSFALTPNAAETFTASLVEAGKDAQAGVR